MTETNPGHPNEETLERFLLGTLSKEDLEMVETHVLACDLCVEQLESMESDIATLKTALREFESGHGLKQVSRRSKRQHDWFTLPKLSFAGAGAVLAAVMIYLSIPQKVELTAYRGSETTVLPEGRPLDLHLNALDAESGPVVVELVNGHGFSKWKGSAEIRNEALDVRIPRITKSGNYFLRIYSAHADASVHGGAELLREFSVRVSWRLFR